MRTLQEHLDDLDRMVDSGSAPKHEIRSQIAFIGREVTALEADYARFIDAHTQSERATAKVLEDLQTQNQALVSENKKLIDPDSSMFAARGGSKSRRQQLEDAGL
jgi:hypothetical protein